MRVCLLSSSVLLLINTRDAALLIGTVASTTATLTTDGKSSANVSAAEVPGSANVISGNKSTEQFDSEAQAVGKSLDVVGDEMADAEPETSKLYFLQLLLHATALTFIIASSTMGLGSLGIGSLGLGHQSNVSSTPVNPFALKSAVSTSKLTYFLLIYSMVWFNLTLSAPAYGTGMNSQVIFSVAFPC